MSVDEITEEMAKVEIDDKLKNYVSFYKNSLKTAGEDINVKKKTTRLASVVGNAYEEHRKRVWEHLEFTVDKLKNNADFDVDWSIYYHGKLVAFEEDKGHYVDKCFFERCIHGFIGTINNKGIECPKLILSAFTRYNLHIDTEKKSLEVYKENLVEIFRDNYTYNYLNEYDRISKEKWFSSDSDSNHNPYEEYQNDELIIKDIRFMLSLKK